MTFSRLMLEWYNVLNTLNVWFSLPLGDLSDQVNIPAFSALILGLIGALSPCQLSSNVAAIAFANRHTTGAASVSRSFRLALAYIAGKATLYTALGLLAWSIGQRLNSQLIPVIQTVRIWLGPALVLGGLALLGLLPWRRSIGIRMSHWFEDRLGSRGGMAGAYLLGLIFAMGFCPTLFWLFFGLLIPLVIANPGGVLYPLVFAVGTAVPLLLCTSLISAGQGRWQMRVRQLQVGGRVVNVVAGIAFLLVGLNDMLLYLIPALIG